MKIGAQASITDMEQLNASDLSGFKLDKNARKKFHQSAFRYSGPGAIVFIVVLAIIMYQGLELSKLQSYLLFSLAAVGFLYEMVWFFLAKIKKPVCSSCDAKFNVCLNSERPKDTEYLYVCNQCNTYFKVLHSEESDW